MRKIISLFFVCIFLLTPFVQAYGNSVYSIKIADNRTINISSVGFQEDIRVLVEKDNQRYYYSLLDSDEELPLQLGKGKYDVKILQNINDDKFKVIAKQTLNLSKYDEKEIFLVSAQPVIWKENGQAAKLAKELTKGLVNDKDKVIAIYNYIVKNISYDFNKAAKLDNDYIPNNDDTLEILSGICYDYASLMAAMLRSLNISTKLVKGYKNDIESYHAWNEVLIDDHWVIIDTTYDSAFVKVDRSIHMIKSNNEYVKVREY